MKLLLRAIGWSGLYVFLVLLPLLAAAWAAPRGAPGGLLHELGVAVGYVALSMLADALTLSPAHVGDAELALQWRNDERTRRHFRDPKPVSREDHLRWWAQTLAGRERELLLARCGHGAVGVVRLDRKGGGDAEISYYLDPELTGLGLGSAALRAAQRWIEARADVSRIVAHVLPGNRASANAFAAAGFARLGDNDWQWRRSP